MTLRQPFLALMVLLLPASAWADRHRWDLSAGASASNGGSLLWGEQISTGFVLPNSRGFVLVGDFSHHSETDLERNTFLTGLRYMRPYPKEPPTAHGEPAEENHASPFVHVLLGEVHTTRRGVKSVDFAAAVGLGIDAPLAGSLYGRVQADAIRVWSLGSADTVFRVSVGLVFRLEDSHHKP